MEEKVRAEPLLAQEPEEGAAADYDGPTAEPCPGCGGRLWCYAHEVYCPDCSCIELEASR